MEKESVCQFGVTSSSLSYFENINAHIIALEVDNGSALQDSRFPESVLHFPVKRPSIILGKLYWSPLVLFAREVAPFQKWQVRENMANITALIHPLDWGCCFSALMKEEEAHAGLTCCAPPAVVLAMKRKARGCVEVAVFHGRRVSPTPAYYYIPQSGLIPPTRGQEGCDYTMYYPPAAVVGVLILFEGGHIPATKCYGCFSENNMLAVFGLQQHDGLQLCRFRIVSLVKERERAGGGKDACRCKSFHGEGEAESKKKRGGNVVEGALQVDDPGELRNAVEERVAALEHLLVLSVLGVWPGGLHDAVHLIDLSVQTIGSDEPRKLPAQNRGE